MSESIDKLTAKEEKFCNEYVLYLNGAKAAIEAGYAEKSARITASRLLTKDNIANRIKYLKENLAEASGISSLRVLREFEKIAFSSIAHLHNTWIEREKFEKLTDEQKVCIKSISTKILKKNIGSKKKPKIIDVEYVKVDLYDKMRALENVNKMLGYDSPTRLEITGKDGSPLIPISRETARKIIENL